MPLYLLFFIVFVCQNILLWFVFKRLHPLFGSLLIDDSDPEDVKMRLVIDKDIDAKHHQYVTLKISHESITPRK